MNSDDNFFYIILGIAIFFIALIIIFLIHGAVEKKRDKERIRQEQKAGIWMSAVFTHISGLPIASGANVKCCWYDDKIVFYANGSNFNLPIENLIDVSEKTNATTQTEYVTSNKKAVAGAVLFGTPGAIIGSQPKKKTNTYFTSYINFTYKSKDGESIKYITFNTASDSYMATKMVEYFNTLPKQNVSIDL